MPDSHDKIIKLLQDKIRLKQEVFEETHSVFEEMKSVLSDLAASLKSDVKSLDKTLTTEYKINGDFEVEFTLADETLVFVMHTNIFTFDSGHEIWRQKYVQQDNSRSFCGKIFIYNFLSDSFRYNRVNDVGYLIARIFVNKERHYFVEGNKHMGHLYSDFQSTVLDRENIEKLIETAICYSLDFDPFTPPFQYNTEISVKEVIEAGVQTRIATGKRLGFTFEAD